MPRAKRKISTVFPYHVTARCINREWFQLPMDEVWEIFNDYLYLTKYAFNLEIHLFVLMNNHFHLIVSTPKGNLPAAMNYLMREVSREIARRVGRINQIFGHTYHSSLITSNHYYLHAYKYVYRNPVEAKIVAKVEDYKYSTLNGLLGNSLLFIPVSLDETLFGDVEGTLNWLNEEYKGENKDKVRKALRKNTFMFAPCPTNRKPDELESILS